MMKPLQVGVDICQERIKVIGWTKRLFLNYVVVDPNLGRSMST